jgi:Leucine-rich repeat (LRR) protein
VTQLGIGDNNLIGRLPDDIGNLTEMDRIWITNNPGLVGPLPPVIVNLTKLRSIQIWDTGLSGPIPPELANLSEIDDLYLQDSQFEGQIPPEIGNLIKLKILSFGRNNLTGPIPPELGNLINLTSLILNENQLSGHIPPELGNLVNLETLWLNHNELTGPIPPEFYNMISMDNLVLESNEFEGIILPEINNMHDIRTIRINSNYFTGFPDISPLAPISTLDIQDNRLTFRDIEPNVGNSDSYMYWPQDSVGTWVDTTLHPGQSYTLFTSAGGNNTIYQWKRYGVNIGEASFDSTYTFPSLTMENDGRYICEITNTVATLVKLYTFPVRIRMEYTPRQLDSLALVDMYKDMGGSKWHTNTNWLTDADINTWHGITMNDDRVTDIQLSNQNLTGQLPTSIGNLNRLENMYLANNSITGGIPAEIGLMETLQQIWLNSNSLNQVLPDEITNLEYLERLHLTNNQIPGPIPEGIGNMTELWDLALAHNLFNGNIPASITNLVNLQSLWLEDNNLNGSLPENMGDLSNLTALSIGENEFKGAVPSSITGLTFLTTLKLHKNRLDELPDLAKLSTNLDELTIENNNFTFEDIEPNMAVAATFSYIPQDSTGVERDTTVTSGSALTLDANVGGENNSYLWYLNNNPLNTETSSLITISPVDGSNIGSYHCQVTNSVVTDLTIYTRPVRIWIIGPPELKTDPATNVSTSSAVLNGSVNPNGLSTNISFLYSEDQTTWTTVTATPGTIEGAGDQTVTTELTSLPSKTTYWFKVSATNSEGTKEGEVLSFTTLSLESPPTVSTGIPTGISSSSAFLSGTVNPNDLPTGAYFQFTDSSQVAINQTTPLTGITNINVDASATGLRSDTFYQVRLVAANDSGRTNGTWESFRTLIPGTGPSAITQAADQISVSSARLNGLVNPSGMETEVKFLWGSTTSYGDSVLATQSPINGNTDIAVNATVTGLTTGTIYHFKVKASNAGGRANGDNMEFRTHFPVVDLSEPQDGETDVSVRPTFQWKPVTDAPGYRFQLATDTGFNNLTTEARNRQGTLFIPSITLEFGSTYFWRVSVDADGVIPVWSTTRTFKTGSYPTTIDISTQITFPSKPNNSDYLSTDYRIFGLPGKTNIALTEIFGEAVDDRWIAYWDNGQSTNFQVKHDNSGRFEFQTGKAFWIIYKGSLPITRQVNTPTLNSQNEAEIPLHAGWNLIANPFDFDVNWSEVQAINVISGPLHRFNGSFSTTTQMNPYEGYYYFNDPGAGTLRVPIAPGMAKPLMTEDFQWKIEIHLTMSNQKDHSTRLGVAPDASRGIDRYDYRKPRTIGAIPGVYFLRPEWDEQFSVFASDVRSEINGLDIWEFQTDVPSKKKAELFFQGLADIPGEYEVYLIDKTRSSYINLRKEEKYTYSYTQETSHFELVVGEKSRVLEKIAQIIPTEFALGLNFPNPFNPTTTISLLIPKKSETTLKIFNILGQEIITVYNGNLEAGRHFFKWNGVNKVGQQVPSGVYIYTMSTDHGHHFARKMVLIR